jgi:isopenicillin N synthase-like dioxygenase
VTATIPTLDVQRFINPRSAEDRAAFVAELGACYREWGFAGIRNHGIPQAQIDRAYEVFQRFFALPEEVKRKYHIPGGGGARGYTPFGIETAKGAQYHDLKEFWHVGREIPRDSRYAEVMPANIWPEEIPEFREVAYGLYQALDELGSQVIGG